MSTIEEENHRHPRPPSVYSVSTHFWSQPTTLPWPTRPSRAVAISSPLSNRTTRLVCSRVPLLGTHHHHHHHHHHHRIHLLSERWPRRRRTPLPRQAHSHRPTLHSMDLPLRTDPTRPCSKHSPMRSAEPPKRTLAGCVVFCWIWTTCRTQSVV